ncbi:MAG: NAD(+) diphosphatase [Sphingomonadaceae bacterium]|nr:NAD(+) diphosphatase [Sphingomonadaceae bacterium]
MNPDLTPPGLTGSTLDRADAVRLSADRLAAARADIRARLLRLDDLDPRISPEGALGWTSLADLAEGHEPLFLGLDEGVPCFAAFDEDAPSAGQAAYAVWRHLDLMTPDQASTYAAARALIEWHRRHRFCAACGARSAVFRGGWGRRCEACDAEHFPRVDPVVIMLAEHEGKALVGRQPRFPPGRYSALAGFVEPGESIEEAVARELFEEAGVRASSARYVASQPWPFPGSLMIACVAPVESDALALDSDELEHAIWVSRDEVRAAFAGDPAAPFLAPPHFAIAHTLLARWAACDG